MKQLSPELMAAVTAGLNALGFIWKQTPFLKNWMIPHMLFITGAVVTPFLAEAYLIKDIILCCLQGGILGLAAVGLNQAYRQTTEGRAADNTTTVPPAAP